MTFFLPSLGRPGHSAVAATEGPLPHGWSRAHWPILLCFLAATACDLQRSFDVQGRIVGFGDDGRTVLVEHEDIPRLMPAMTMSFQTDAPGMLEGFETGQAIRFTLHVARDSSWISDLVALPDSAVALHPAGTPDPVFQQDTVLLRPGDPAPDVALLDQNGTAFQLSGFQGKALVVTFIYTRCPLPDYCPLMSRNFQVLQPITRERYGDRVHYLSISFDPEYDTPEVLRTYAARYTDALDTWTFATGEREAIATAAIACGVYYEAEAGEIIHNLATVLMGPDGRVRQIWRGNSWQPSDVLKALPDVLGDS